MAEAEVVQKNGKASIAENNSGPPKYPTGLFINGEFIDVESKLGVVNPSTGEVIAKVCLGGKEDIDRAVAAAKAAWNGPWRDLPTSERAALLRRVADKLGEKKDEIAEVVVLENGKVHQEAVDEVTRCVETFHYYAGWCDKIGGDHIETMPNRLVFTRLEPYGVCGGISPWNYPLEMPLWKIAPCLAAGNTMVLKCSEETPLSALYIAQATQGILPPGVLNVVSGYGKVAGKALAEHMDVKKISFTGSTAVGRLILEYSAKSNMKDVGLECGGKSACMIFPDCDRQQTLDAIMSAVYENMGQNCCQGSRLLIHESIYDEFMNLFTEESSKLQPGAGLTPLISQRHIDRVLGMVQKGKEQSKLLFGGEQLDRPGFYLQPTCFEISSSSEFIWCNEIFAPVSSVMKFSSAREALDLANDTTYGLAAAVFTKNLDVAFSLANDLQAGTVWVNEYNMMTCAEPFGGFNQSGNNVRDLGKKGLESWMQTKAVRANLGDGYKKFQVREI